MDHPEWSLLFSCLGPVTDWAFYCLVIADKCPGRGNTPSPPPTGDKLTLQECVQWMADSRRVMDTLPLQYIRQLVWNGVDHTVY